MQTALRALTSDTEDFCIVAVQLIVVQVVVGCSNQIQNKMKSYVKHIKIYSLTLRTNISPVVRLMSNLLLAGLSGSMP